MSQLYEQLNTSSQTERQKTAGRLIDHMRRGTPNGANEAYFGLCKKIISDLDYGRVFIEPENELIEFSPTESAQLIYGKYGKRRVSGYLQAIARAPAANIAVDAGCGSTAILSAGIALLHPKSEVEAYELNEASVHCATVVLELLGLGDRVHVHNADVLSQDLPRAGLVTEKGPFIAERLAQSSREILPSFAVLFATDGDIEDDSVWQPTSTIDFRRHHERISGHFVSTTRGCRPILAYAGLYDARGGSVLTGPATDAINNHVFLGTMDIPAPGMPIGFSYALGWDIPEHTASLWFA